MTKIAASPLARKITNQAAWLSRLARHAYLDARQAGKASARNEPEFACGWKDLRGREAERDPLMESSRHVSASLGRGPSVYKRELPAILAVLEQLPAAPELVIVDAYVDLGPGRPGLGRRLFDAIGIPVIGVAKTRFAEADAIEVLRGSSARPLFVTAAGVDAMKAAAWIREMHGASRLPTLLKLVDRLARSRQ